MDCREAKGLFVDFQDGALSKEDHTRMEAHLAGCEACAGEWAAYQKTAREISGLIHVEPKAGFPHRVKRTIGYRSRGRFFGVEAPYSLKFAFVSFVLILIILVVYYTLFAAVVVTDIDSGAAGDRPDRTDPAGSAP